MGLVSCGGGRKEQTQRLKGKKKKKKDHYFACLAVPQCRELEVTAHHNSCGGRAGALTPSLAGFLEMCSGQRGVLVLGRAPKPSLGASGGRAGGAAAPQPIRLPIPRGGCAGGSCSPRGAPEPTNVVPNHCPASWKTPRLHARPLTDDEFAIPLGNGAR